MIYKILKHIDKIIDTRKTTSIEIESNTCNFLNKNWNREMKTKSIPFDGIT